MPHRQIEYASLPPGSKRKIAPAAKWTLIVGGLILAAFVLFVILMFRYLNALGPMAG
jgi:hypothetical protein